jgi:integrase
MRFGTRVCAHASVVVRGIFGTHKGSPALAWDWKALGTGPKDDLAFYDPSEVARLIDAAESERDAAIYALATMAGPRMSEIRGLRVGDVDFAAGLLRFVQGYTDDGGFASVKGHELRSVPMAPTLAARLRPYCSGRPADALVFRPERGADALCGSALYRRFIDAADRAGLRRIRFHDLRHSFGTQRSSDSTFTRCSGGSDTSRSRRPRSTSTTAPMRARRRRWMSFGARRRPSCRCPNVPPNAAKLPPRRGG